MYAYQCTLTHIIPNIISSGKPTTNSPFLLLLTSNLMVSAPCPWNLLTPDRHADTCCYGDGCSRGGQNLVPVFKGTWCGRTTNTTMYCVIPWLDCEITWWATLLYCIPVLVQAFTVSTAVWQLIDKPAVSMNSCKIKFLTNLSICAE